MYKPVKCNKKKEARKIKVVDRREAKYGGCEVLGRMGDCGGIHFRTGATMRAGETG